MTRYRIYTEERSDTLQLILSSFTAVGVTKATIYQGTGVWNGNLEPSLTIEIFTEDHERIRQLAALIEELNEQETVLITSDEVAVCESHEEPYLYPEAARR